jgi:hypothetical protein
MSFKNELIKKIRNNNIENIPINILREIPCDILNSELDENQKDVFSDIIVKYYYDKGFPFYQLSDKKTKNVLIKMYSCDVNTLDVSNNEIQQNMLGLNLANSFHKQMWSVKCRNSLTPMDIFNDKDFFKQAIKKRLKYSDTPLQDLNIRKSLKIFSGAQSVSNFRPTVAKYMYEKYSNGGFVLDPSAGYSGRLIGAITSNIKRYDGIEPCSETYNCNIKAYNKIVYLIKEINRDNLFTTYCYPKVNFYKEAFEDFNTNQKYDLVFTSPPYFNIEKYSYENTQSWIRYKTYENWKEKFLKVLIEKSYDFLCNKGFFALNAGGEPLVEDTKEYIVKTFGGIHEIKYMRLSSIMGAKKDKFKLEPILITQK